MFVVSKAFRILVFGVLALRLGAELPGFGHYWGFQVRQNITSSV